MTTDQKCSAVYARACNRRLRSCAALVALVALHGALPGSALAQASAGAAEPAPPGAAASSSADRARTREATEWFLRGRALMERGRYADAARAFEASQELASAASTLLNLGRAHALQRDPARALSAYERAALAAESAASEAQREALRKAAQTEIAALRPKVATLTLTRPETPGLVLWLNGTRLEPSVRTLRLNPGLYRLEASAPDTQTHAEELRLEAGQSVTRIIPPLPSRAPSREPAPGAPLPASAPELAAGAGAAAEGTSTPAARSPELGAAAERPEASARPGPRFGALPWVLVGAGAGLGGASLITGLSAKSKADSVKHACPGLSNCDPALQDDYDGARGLALATDVLWITGATAIAAGATLFILRASDERAGELEAACFMTSCALRGRF